MSWALASQAVTARVRVPATSGNLGPGFDSLGLAYQLYDEVAATIVAGPTTVTVTGEGAGEVPLDENHLVLRAMRRTFEFAGAPQPNLQLVCHNRIPHGRGLGSSASAVVAGIAAARALLPGPEVITQQQILELATEFEGHPDNAAPAIYGGATTSWMENGKPFAVQIPVSSEVYPFLLVPSNSLATKAARAVLPSEIPFADAVFNVGRIALLTQALSTHPQLLFPATEDKLHQPYRASVMPESAAVVTNLRSKGNPAVVSGAGPTVLVFGTFADTVDNLAESAQLDLNKWRILPLAVDKNGVQTTRELL